MSKIKKETEMAIKENELTNKKAIDLNKVMEGLDTAFFNDTQNKIKFTDGFHYGLKKNIRRTIPIVKELEEIEKDLMTKWKKDVGFDDKNTDESYLKEMQEKFMKYRKENISVIEVFLEEKSDFEIYYISEDDFDNSTIPSITSNYLAEILMK